MNAWMIQHDAKYILELKQQVKALDDKITQYASRSNGASRLRSKPSFGATSSAELAGEIGIINRFEKEAGLALYPRMAPLDRHSGKQSGVRPARHIDTRVKAAMMIAADRHRKYYPQS